MNFHIFTWCFRYFNILIIVTNTSWQTDYLCFMQIYLGYAMNFDLDFNKLKVWADLVLQSWIWKFNNEIIWQSLYLSGILGTYHISKSAKVTFHIDKILIHSLLDHLRSKMNTDNTFLSHVNCVYVCIRVLMSQ